MAMSSAAKIEHELLERVSLLSPAQKRETLDFVEFIASRSRKSPNQRHGLKRKISYGSSDVIIGIAPLACPLDAIIDIASECKDTDLSVNHDKYLYGDDPL
jgi:hypothetical protein